jgi:hypothetical protein
MSSSDRDASYGKRRAQHQCWGAGPWPIQKGRCRQPTCAATLCRHKLTLPRVRSALPFRHLRGTQLTSSPQRPPTFQTSTSPTGPVRMGW